MTKLALFGGVLLVCSASALAQAPPTQNPDSSSPSTESTDRNGSQNGKTVMLSGCIREQDGKYVLITNTQSAISSPNASSTAPSNSEPSNPPSTQPGNSTQSRQGNEVELTGSQDLKKHVGHTVRVTGTMEKSSAAGRNDNSPSTPPSSTSNEPGANNANRSTLRVSEIKMVSES